MSVNLLAAVKAHLRLTHSDQDAYIQSLIDGAEDETKHYLGRDELPKRDAPYPDCTSDGTDDPASDSDDIAPTVRTGIFMLVQALFDGVDAEQMEGIRAQAFALMRPYRANWGV